MNLSLWWTWCANATGPSVLRNERIWGHHGCCTHFSFFINKYAFINDRRVGCYTLGSVLKDLEVVIELDRRGGRRRGAAPSCWQVDGLNAVRGAETPRAAVTPEILHLRFRVGLFFFHRLELITWSPQDSFLKPQTSFNFFNVFFVPPFSSPQDFKMALHGLTARKAKADLFDYCFVTAKPALSDWACNAFSCTFFRKFWCFYHKDGRYSDFKYNMLFYAAFHFVIA